MQVEELDLEYNEGVMLLPIMALHTIDERSPLWGYSHDSLQVCHSSHPQPNLWKASRQANMLLSIQRLLSLIVLTPNSGGYCSESGYQNWLL